jgi:hypothetical protein
MRYRIAEEDRSKEAALTPWKRLCRASSPKQEGRPKIRIDGSFVGAWLSLVERVVRDDEVAGSNPVAPTIPVKV